MGGRVTTLMPRAARWRLVEAVPRGVCYNQNSFKDPNDHHHHHHNYATVLHNKDEKNDLNNEMAQYYWESHTDVLVN